MLVGGVSRDWSVGTRHTSRSRLSARTHRAIADGWCPHDAQPPIPSLPRDVPGTVTVATSDEPTSDGTAADTTPSDPAATAAISAPVCPALASAVRPCVWLAPTRLALLVRCPTDSGRTRSCIDKTPKATASTTPRSAIRGQRRANQRAGPRTVTREETRGEARRGRADPTLPWCSFAASCGVSRPCLTVVL